MKKFIVSVLSICVFANAAFAYGERNYEEFNEYKSKYRILYGLLLVVGGGFLAYDGFRTVKIDISKPSHSFTSSAMWNASPYPGQVTLQSKGTFTNTGNVILRDVAFQVRYRSDAWQSGYYFPGQGFAQQEPVGVWVNFPNTASQTLYVSDIGQTYEWNRGSEDFSMSDANGHNPDAPYQGQWYPEADPNKQLAEIVNVSYIWDKKYKEEMNNVYEGLAGAALLGAGVYILVDYIVSLNRFNYYMQKRGIDVYVENNCEEFQLKMSKRI